jgi:hypothetical protein
MKRWLQKRLPAPEVLANNRWLKPFAHRLAEPALWHLNRRSVERGVALGLFIGLIVPLGQTPVAALLAVSVRANVIVAAAATLITNPLTFPAIYYAAYRLGSHVVPAGSTGRSPADAAGGLSRGLAWLADASLPTAVGLLLFAVTSAAAGFAIVRHVWRWWVRRGWQRRRSIRSRRRCG